MIYVIALLMVSFLSVVVMARNAVPWQDAWEDDMIRTDDEGPGRN